MALHSQEYQQLVLVVVVEVEQLQLQVCLLTLILAQLLVRYSESLLMILMVQQAHQN